ncbi:MAG: hypothetical protein ACRC7G_07670 [Beijerinckiaceae bacterium]
MVDLSGKLVEAEPAVRIETTAWSQPDRVPENLQIEYLPAARLETILPAWKALSQNSFDDNPFLSPAFLLPLIQHDLSPADLVAALVWRAEGNSRRLVGFQPLRPAVRAENSSVLAFGPREAQAWSHAWQPVSVPLLAADELLAASVLRVLLKSIASLRHHPGTLSWTSVPFLSRFRALLAATTSSLGLAVESAPDAPETLGLDFRPAECALLPAPVVEMCQQSYDAPALLERILVLEAGTGYAPLVHDPAAAGFVRAMARGLAADGRLLLALTPGGPQALGAVVISSRTRAWLWRLVGPGVSHPHAEAALIGAIGRKLGLPVSPANGRRLTGIGLDVEALHALRVELRPGPRGLARRISGRMFGGGFRPLRPSNASSAAA